MPLFADPAAHATLVSALELQIAEAFPVKPDVIVGLDARGFLFGPGLALRLGVSFAAVRKPGKLPGPCATAEYVKEYGKDLFQMQEDAVRPGQKVLIVDDIIATGKSFHSTMASSCVSWAPADVLPQVVLPKPPPTSFTSSRVRLLDFSSSSRSLASTDVTSSVPPLLLFFSKMLSRIVSLIPPTLLLNLQPIRVIDQRRLTLHAPISIWASQLLDFFVSRIFDFLFIMCV